MSEVLWEPSPEHIASTALARFAGRAPGRPDTYEDLWTWSIEDIPGFWAQVWEDCEVIAARPYEQVMGEPRMPGTAWFSGARLNFAENLLRQRGARPVLVGAGEGRSDEHVTADDLLERVGRAQRGLGELGVGPGDRVAGVLPNSVETVVLMLATTALGAVWSGCSPDFGVDGIVDRFAQIRPKVLCTVDGYRYGGRVHTIGDKTAAVLAAIDGIEAVVHVGFVDGGEAAGSNVVRYEEWMAGPAAAPTFAHLPPDHPLFVLYTSGTTGLPKSIVHGAAGTLVKHLEEHRLHWDVRPGDVVFWFTTSGWVVWNLVVSALASGATVVCYDGSPFEPDPWALWHLAERLGVTHFGTSPRYLAGLAQQGLRPGERVDLDSLRVLLSSGSPLLPEQFDWVYANVKSDLQLASISGGTDLIGCFAAGVPTLPVRRGELQARCLGMAVEAWDDEGRPLVGAPGELVCTRPFPSMPLGFWGDEDGDRYHDAYFARFPGVWTHGDFVEIRAHGGVVIHGRSDTTLNPGGVRIGTAEIYRAVEQVPEVEDSIVVDRPADGDVDIVLFVKLASGEQLDDDLTERIRQVIRSSNTPRHVPAEVIQVSAIPYTITGKKVEQAVRLALRGQPVPTRDTLADPQALDEYVRLASSVSSEGR